MKSCPQCSEENDDDERFCRSCGADAGDAGPPAPPPVSAGASGGILDEPTRIIRDRPPGRLVLMGETLTTVDGSQRLMGRADLKMHTDMDPELISRSHFTVYRKDLRYLIKDGITSVQDRPSAHGTLLNGRPLEVETELKNGDRITVSDIDMTFEV